MSKTDKPFPPHFLTLEFFTKENCEKIFRLAENFTNQTSGETYQAGLVAKNSNLINQVEKAVRQTGGIIKISSNEIIDSETKLQELEFNKCDVFFSRFSDHRLAENLAKKFTTSVVNLGSDWAAPCQILADYYTIYQLSPENFKLCFVGQADACCQSWMRAAALFDFQLRLCCPRSAQPDNILFNSLRDRGTDLKMDEVLKHPRQIDYLYPGKDFSKLLDQNKLKRDVFGPNTRLLTNQFKKTEPGDNLFWPERDKLSSIQKENLVKILKALFVLFRASPKSPLSPGGRGSG